MGKFWCRYILMLEISNLYNLYNGAEHGLATRVVFDLMVSYLDKGYHLYVDKAS